MKHDDWVTEADIAAKEQEVASLKARKMAQESSPLIEVVIKLHDKFCHYDHTEGCGWHYEISKGIHQWGGNGTAHHRWMETATNLVEGIARMIKKERPANEGPHEAFPSPESYKIILAFIENFKT